MELDLRALAHGVVVNNMGVDGIELRVRGAMENGVVTFAETTQRLPVRGGPTASSKPWLVFDVAGWEANEELVLVWNSEQDSPTASL